jgi:hypothetical protein
VEDRRDGSQLFGFLGENWVEEGKIEYGPLVEGDSSFVGSDIVSFGEVVADWFKYAVDILTGGVDVIVDDGDVMVCEEEEFNANMRSDVTDSPGHKYVFYHSLMQ